MTLLGTPAALYLLAAAGGLALATCKSDPQPALSATPPAEAINKCTVLGGEFGSPGFAACLVDRFHWSSDSVVQMVQDSVRALEIEMAKARAAARESLMAISARISAAQAAAALKEKQDQARKQAILDSMEADLAGRRLKASAPKPSQ